MAKLSLLKAVKVFKSLIFTKRQVLKSKMFITVRCARWCINKACLAVQLCFGYNIVVLVLVKVSKKDCFFKVLVIRVRLKAMLLNLFLVFLIQ